MHLDGFQSPSTPTDLPEEATILQARFTRSCSALARDLRTRNFDKESLGRVGAPTVLWRCCGLDADSDQVVRPVSALVMSLELGSPELALAEILQVERRQLPARRAIRHRSEESEVAT